MMKRSLLVLIGVGICAVAVHAADGGYDPHGMRDPFLPLVTSAGAMITYDTGFSVSEMVLEGIIADESGQMAIINGNIVEKGKMIGLYTIQAIEADRVILLKGTETSVLQLKKEE